jgi:GNAT superfamily N-acetyltransferase
MSPPWELLPVPEAEPGPDGHPGPDPPARPRTPALEAFLALPARVYADDPWWAPRSEQVVAQRLADAAAGRVAVHAVVAVVDGRPLARAAAIREPDAVDPDGRPEGWIGLFECLSDDLGRAAGVAVLQHCRRWLVARGAGRVIGPRTDALLAGLLVAGFDQPQLIATAHNPPGYLGVFARAGAVEVSRLLAYRFTRDRVPSFPASGGRGIEVRGARPEQLADEVRRIHAFQRAVFRPGVGHLRRDLAATERLAERLLPLLDPDLVLFAEDRAGEVAGVLLCLPDAWQPREAGAAPDRARLVSIGVLPGWRRRGVALAMGAALAERLLVRGYKLLEASWVLGRNRPPQLLAAAVGARPSREFALLAWEPDREPHHRGGGADAGPGTA